MILRFVVFVHNLFRGRKKGSTVVGGRKDEEKTRLTMYSLQEKHTKNTSKTVYLVLVVHIFTLFWLKKFWN